MTEARLSQESTNPKSTMRQTTKTLLGAAAALAMTAGAAQADLIISEICDAPLTGGQPKWVQITNTGPTDIADLSAYSLGNFNNGGTTLGGGSATVLNAVPLTVGSHYVLAYESSGNTACDPAGLVTCFEYAYGFAADQYTGPFVNGDDVIALYLGAATGDGSDATLIDLYGNIGEDGTGTVWEYTDSYAYRCGDSGSATFADCDWTIAGPDALEDPGGDPAELIKIQNLTTPTTHVGCTPTCGSGAITYCTAKVNSQGCTPALVPDSGQPSSGGAAWNITAQMVLNNKPGIFFYGFGQNNLPFQGGFLCVQPPTQRLAPSNTGGNPPPDDCSGTLAVDVAALALTPGMTVNFQCWTRDPASPSTTNLTDGCEVIIQ